MGRHDAYFNQKWGNSQGLRVPREVCDYLGVDIGSSAEMTFDVNKSQIIITFNEPNNAYRRNKKMSLQEIAAGWTGGKTGEEWGGEDVGSEVIP